MNKLRKTAGIGLLACAVLTNCAGGGRLANKEIKPQDEEYSSEISTDGPNYKGPDITDPKVIFESGNYDYKIMSAFTYADRPNTVPGIPKNLAALEAMETEDNDYSVQKAILEVLSPWLFSLEESYANVMLSFDFYSQRVEDIDKGLFDGAKTDWTTQNFGAVWSYNRCLHVRNYDAPEIEFNIGIEKNYYIRPRFVTTSYKYLFARSDEITLLQKMQDLYGDNYCPPEDCPYEATYMALGETYDTSPDMAGCLVTYTAYRDKVFSVVLKKDLSFNTTTDDRFTRFMTKEYWDINSRLSPSSWADKVFIDDISLDDMPGQQIIFTDDMRGNYNVDIYVIDDAGNTGTFLGYNLTVEDTSPPDVWVRGSDAETAEESQQTPFYISQNLIGEPLFLEAAIRSSIYITDHGEEISAYDAAIQVPQLKPAEETAAVVMVEDDLGNKAVAYLKLHVRNDIPSLIAVNNSTLLSSPVEPVLAQGQISDAIFLTADYGPDKALKAVQIDNNDYLEYARLSGRIGEYPIKYQAFIESPGATEPDILDKVITIKVLAQSTNPPHPKTEWDKLLEWIQQEGYWLWPVAGITVAVLIALAVWANWPRKRED